MNSTNTAAFKFVGYPYVNCGVRKFSSKIYFTKRPSNRRLKNIYYINRVSWLFFLLLYRCILKPVRTNLLSEASLDKKLVVNIISFVRGMETSGLFEIL
jgi:hypothetical protein